MFFFSKVWLYPGLARPLGDFLQVLAFSGSWFFAPRTKERKKQTNKEQKKDMNKERNKDRTKEGNEETKETKKERNKENLA